MAVSLPKEGRYRKHDGLTFTIRHLYGPNGVTQPVLEFEGRLHLLTPRNANDYDLSWRYGNAVMRYESQFSCFVENGAIRFYHADSLSTTRVSFNDWERRHLRECGYLVVPGGVPEAQVSLALEDEAVKSLVAQASASDVGGGSRWKTGNSSGTSVVNLVSGMWGAIESLFGDGVRLPPPTHAQVAVVGAESPSETQALKLGELSPGYHIDGLHAPGNGIPPNEVRNFNLLVGVALTDTLLPNCGNFAVIPFSHQALIHALSQHPQGCDSLRIPEGGTVKATLDRLLDDPCKNRNLCPSAAICVPRGTVYLCQYALCHFVQPNCNPDSKGPRVAVYFRLTNPNRPSGCSFYPDPILKPELELPGLYK
jgi:hypothetical protein